jgi:hypothetical protein
MSLNFAKLIRRLEAIIEKQNQFIDSIKTRLEFYRTERWAWGHSVCTSECDSLQWGHFLRMSGRYQLEDQCTWLRSVNSFSSMLKSIPRVRCAGRSIVSGDHTWNSDLHRVIDEGFMEFENGLSLSEFPSREVGG